MFVVVDLFFVYWLFVFVIVDDGFCDFSGKLFEDGG